MHDCFLIDLDDDKIKKVIEVVFDEGNGDDNFLSEIARISSKKY